MELAVLLLDAFLNEFRALLGNELQLLGVDGLCLGASVGVVEEAGVCRGAMAELRIIELLERRAEDMRTGVPEDLAALVVVERTEANGAVALQDAGQVGRLAIDQGAYELGINFRGFDNLLGRLHQRGALRQLARVIVGQGDSDITLVGRLILCILLLKCLKFL